MNSIRTRNTLLFAVLLLFFVQLFSMWIESTYRMSLVKLGPGREMFGTLLLLLPVVLFFANEKRERVFLWAALLTFLAARLLCPHLGAVGQIVVGGMGVSMFLVVLACLSSERFSALRGDMGQAFGLAVLLSVVFRSWGSSIDISTEGATVLLAWLIALLAILQFRAALPGSASASVSPAPPLMHSTFAMLGLFANLALAYLMYSSPAVVCAWSGYAQLGRSGVGAVACTAGAFAATLLIAHRISILRMPVACAWNILFVALLVGGLIMGRRPISEDPAVMFMTTEALPGKTLLYLALLLAPVAIFNVRHVAGLSPFARPRNAILPIMVGMALLLILPFALIVTNVWGYVPFGNLFRNHFHVPFLIAGIGILLPWAWRSKVSAQDFPASRPLAFVAVLLPVLAVAGAVAQIPRLVTPAPKRDLTVMTYNMQQGSHLNGNRNLRRQLDLLRSINPDIIGLQESDSARPSSGNTDPVRYFAQELGYHAYYGPGSIAGTFGAAILSRYPIRNPRTFFTYSEVDEVGSAMCEIEVDGKTIAVFSNHPAGGNEVMTAFVDTVKSAARQYAHVIAVGDYNFTSREPFYASLSETLRDSAEQLGEANVNKHGGTSSLPDEIDHIFLSSNFQVLESHYLPAPDSETDHPAHWSMVRISQ